MLVVRFDSDQPHGTIVKGALHGPGTGAPTVTAALERTPGAEHGRSVVPEPQPWRQARGRAPEDGSGASRRVSAYPPKTGLPAFGTDFRVLLDEAAIIQMEQLSSTIKIYFFVNIVLEL